MFSMGENQSPVNIAKAAMEHAAKNGYNVVILDTAGRLHVDEDMMEELESIKESCKCRPDHSGGRRHDRSGRSQCGIECSMKRSVSTVSSLPKLDGDTRGGAALSIRAVTGKPILYIGMGEKLSDLEQFYPDRMASRILGMGDILTLIEKAQSWRLMRRRPRR